MPVEDRALAPPRALALAATDPVRAAQARLDAALVRVTALDAEVEALSAALASLAAEVERRLGGPDAEARRAARLVRQLQALADGLAQELARVEAGPDRRGGRGGPRARAGGRGRQRGGRRDPDLAQDSDPEGGGEADGGAEPEAAAGADDSGISALEQQAAELKRIYRRLARLLHPDLAPDEIERVRLSDLMARANAAYEADDLSTLSLMAERLGAGEPPGELTTEERLRHLERRIGQLEKVAASLARERERLERTETARLRAEAERRRAAGGDYFAESVAELAEEAAAARADALLRLAEVGRAGQALGSARRKVMSELERRRSGPVRRAFDPLAESGLVRRSAARLDRARATAPARELARWLEGAAQASPWEAGLTLLAFLAEAAGERPPPAIASAQGLQERWALLRAGWPGAPELAEALARRPRHLVLGARAGREAVVAGLQLAEASLAAGVRIALERTPVAALASQVLGALGPAERCAACQREVLGLHLLRTRGLDERHGVACPRCGAVLRSYWRYGEAEGLEALWPLALELGLVAEVPVRLGGATVGFGLVPQAAAGLTARGLVALLGDLYLTPSQVDLPRGAVRVAADREVLQSRARLAGRKRLAFRLDAGAGTTAEALLELLRTRVERRFRPGG
jgi:hypothetical protein